MFLHTRYFLCSPNLRLSCR